MTNPSTAPASPVDPILGVEHLDPSTLLVDLNVRADATPDRTLIDSIRDLGVLVPVVAVRTESGVRVRFGHRRTLAAIEAKRDTIPVWIVSDDDTNSEAERIVRQWAENEHRANLNNADRLAAVEQLAAFGVSPAQITKRLRAKRADVDAALAASRSALAKGAVDRYGFLDLPQAATVAEFEDDTEAVKALVAAASTGQFEHTAQRLRDARAEVQRHQAVADALTAAGVSVIDRPTYDAKATTLDSLVRLDGTPLTVDTHHQCPGHAAYIATLHGYVDAATGEPVDQEVAMAAIEARRAAQRAADDEAASGYDDEDLCVDCGAHLSEPCDPQCARLTDQHDDQHDDQPDDEAGTGEPLQVQWGHWLGARYVCTDPKSYGHAHRRPSHETARTPVAEMSEAEREASRAQKRDVVQSNKDWASAETVRRDWLRAYVTRKTAAKGTAGFIATAIALDADVIASTGGNTLTADLLGCDAAPYGRNQALAALITDASDARAQVLALTQVLAGYEDATDRNNWRNVSARITRYLRFIQAQGYPLSPVERRACGEDALPTE